MKARILPIVLCICYFIGNAQEEITVRKEIGLNMTTFISQFVPFNNTTSMTGPYDFSFKRYKGNRAFRFGMGMHIKPEVFFSTGRLNSINLRFGFEKRKNIYNKWKYTRAFDAFLYAGNFNLPDDTSDEDGGLGAGMGFGIEYHFNEKVYVSTEAMLLAGLSVESGILLEFLPPMAVFIHMRF